jgi:hypothetical protein
MVDSGEGRSASLGRSARYANLAGTIVLVLVLILLIPPHGILSENEENDFAFAERFVDGSAWPGTTAVFDASRHRMLSDVTLGSCSTVTSCPSGDNLPVRDRCLRSGLWVVGVGRRRQSWPWHSSKGHHRRRVVGGYEAKVAAYVWC